MIIEGMRRLLKGEKRQGNRQQLASQHANRFYEKFHWVHSFFETRGIDLGFHEDIKKEALKYMNNDPRFWRIHLLSKELGSLIIVFYGQINSTIFIARKK